MQDTGRRNLGMRNVDIGVNAKLLRDEQYTNI